MASDQVHPHPVFAERLVALAEGMVEAGHWMPAAELFEMAAALTPRGEALRDRAQVLRGKQPPEDPERLYKRHNLESSHAVGMARVFESRGDLTRAKQMFDLAKLRAPFHYLAYASAGYMHLRRHDLRQALEEFVQARRLNPLDRKLAVEVARIALELEEYGEALRHAVDALLLSQGLSERDETSAHRRVDTLATLCRIPESELAQLNQERVALLQRAAEQVALTRARLFTPTLVARKQPTSGLRRDRGRDLLQSALQLRRFRIFRQFTDSQLMRLTEIALTESFRHAQVVIREGQTDRDFVLVLSGVLHTCRSSAIGTQILATAATGDVVGEVSFIDGRPRSGTVLGVENGVALRFPFESMQELITSDNEIRAALLWSFWYSLATKVRAANDSMTAMLKTGPRTGVRRLPQRGEQIVLDTEAKLSLLHEQGLSAGELRLLATYSREERFGPNALIFGEGDTGDTLYIVVEGQVRISRHIEGLGEEALTILGRGEVFGEMALIDEKPRSADAQAHTHGATVFTIDRLRLEEVLNMDPDAAAQFLTLLCRLMCRRLRAMNDRLVAWRVMASHA